MNSLRLSYIDSIIKDPDLAAMNVSQQELFKIVKKVFILGEDYEMNVREQDIVESKTGFWTYWGGCRDGPWPDQTQAYFWPAVKKGPTWIWSGHFLTIQRDFFDPIGLMIWKINFFGENFPDPERADPTKYYPIWPGSKIFVPNPSLWDYLDLEFKLWVKLKSRLSIFYPW